MTRRTGEFLRGDIAHMLQCMKKLGATLPQQRHTCIVGRDPCIELVLGVTALGRFDMTVRNDHLVIGRTFDDTTNVKGQVAHLYDFAALPEIDRGMIAGTATGTYKPLALSAQVNKLLRR